MEETYKLLDIDPASVQPLDSYLKVGGAGVRVMQLGRRGRGGKGDAIGQKGERREG